MCIQPFYDYILFRAFSGLFASLTLGINSIFGVFLTGPTGLVLASLTKATPGGAGWTLPTWRCPVTSDAVSMGTSLREVLQTSSAVVPGG